MSEVRPGLLSGLVVAVVSAIVAGVFTLAPIAYDYFRNAESLRYWINESLVLTAAPEKQMFFVEIENNGARTAHDIIFDYSRQDAQFQDFSLDAPPGVTISHEVSGQTVSFLISELNSGEIANISFLASGNLSGSEGAAVVRAKGMSRSKIEESMQPKLTFRPAMIFSLLFLYAIMIIFFARRIVPKVARRILGRIGQLDRDEAISYSSRLAFTPEERIHLKGVDTYVGAADAVFLASRSRLVSKNRAISFLACLLRCDDGMASSSRATIVRHLEKLGAAHLVGFAIDKAKRSGDIRSDLEALCFNCGENSQPEDERSGASTLKSKEMT